MGLVINKIQQSSGRTPAGEDFLSGMFFYGVAPRNSDGSSWKDYNNSKYPGITIKAKQLFSPDDCATAGIIPFSDNTSSTATIKITTVGATGDSINITVQVPVIGSTNAATEIINLGTYVVGVADTTKPLQAAAIAATINANTYLTGFTATADLVDTATIHSDKKYGKALNTGTPYVKTITGVMVVTLAQNVVAGTGSQYAVWKYHISEYFRMNPTGNVWVGVVAAISDFNELIVLQSASGNTIRLMGIWDSYSDNDVTDKQPLFQQLQTAAMSVDGIYPFEAIYTFDMNGADLSSLPNGQLYQYNKVTIPISQDGIAYGNFLFRTVGCSIGNMGAKLGTLSKSRVSSDDAQPNDPFFNLSDGTENNVPAFATGDLMENIDENLITQLAARRYIFFTTYTGNVPGTYWNDNWTWCVQTHRYAFMNDNRVASKITRICQKTYVPYLKGEIIYNDDGTISDFSIEILQDAGVDAITAECITGFGNMPLISGAPIVTIDPAQQLQQTNDLQIVVKVGENGIARDITISQGYTN